MHDADPRLFTDQPATPAVPPAGPPSAAEADPTPGRVARCLAPDDIEVGMFVTVAFERIEVLVRPAGYLGPVEVRTITMRTLKPPLSSGTPMRVLNVCLPYVLVELCSTNAHMLDVRRHGLLEVSRSLGTMVFERAAAKRLQAAELSRGAPALRPA
jgi:hypothetical protein